MALGTNSFPLAKASLQQRIRGFPAASKFVRPTAEKGKAIMRMSEFVVRDSISANLSTTQKEGVIREMVENLRAAGFIRNNEPEDIVKQIMKRELLGSTGIGRGVAIPHTKHPSVDRLVGTVAVSRGGVAFESLDGEPVHVLVMLISPQDRPGDHLRALENVSRSLKDDAFVRALREAPSADAVWALLSAPERPS